MQIYPHILDQTAKGRKQLAVLIDPDKTDPDSLGQLCAQAQKAGVDYFFVGGSLVTGDFLHQSISVLKENSQVPVLLFPGNALQVSDKADGLLLLSLISGRNPEMLIGNHVVAAPMIKRAGLEVIPTGYMLVESGRLTSVLYMSNTTPIPSEKNDIAQCTAMAGEMLGLKLIYMDAGSGANCSISTTMIQAVRQSISLPLLIGGGIRSGRQAQACWEAGADIVVIGNILEKSPEVLSQMIEIKNALNK